MKTQTKNKLISYAQTLTEGSSRAQCYHIASLTVNETIANTLKMDHSSQDGHLRAARLMVYAGCAKEVIKRAGLFGKFTFEDGSSFDELTTLV